MANEHIGRALFSGASGQTYEFKVYEPDAAVPAAGGVFVVVDRRSDIPIVGGTDVRLIGRSTNLSQTLTQMKRHARLADSHEEWRFCARVERDSRQARNGIARDLAANYRRGRRDARR